MRILIWLGCLGTAVGAGSVETLRLEPSAGMTRAEIHYVETVSRPRAVLLFCPGANGNGEELVRKKEWQNFARRKNLGLAGLSFASPLAAIHDGSGYYYASRGSGEKLLDGIRKIYGQDIPLLLYGFSGSAHFTSRFEQWRPERVMAWCAYSAGWWDKPDKTKASPPGIVACGEEDSRLGASLIYFKQGRAHGKPWLWISLPEIGHTGSRDLDEFVRGYFSTVLSGRGEDPILVDVDRETIASASEEKAYPSLTARLPAAELLESWRKIHEP